MPLKEVRCCGCHRLLFRATDLAGTVEIKCPRCRQFNHIRPSSPAPERLPRAESPTDDLDAR